MILSHFCGFRNSKGGKTPFFLVFVFFMYKHIGCANFGVNILRIKEKLKFLESFNILTRNNTFRTQSSLGGTGKRMPKNAETIFFFKKAHYLPLAWFSQVQQPGCLLGPGVGFTGLH